MNRFEFYSNLEKFKINEQNKQNESEQSDSLQHYGTLGQKWGVRKWQNYDGTFNEAGKERYFGTKSKSSSSEEEKVGSAKSEAKDFLKFRNKMLKERTRPDLNQWYRDQHKNDDKQLVKNAKKVDKSREKMYRDQLKDFYDDPNELVADLKNVYKISGQNDKVEKKAIKEGKKLEKELLKSMDKNWEEKEKLQDKILNDPKYKEVFDNLTKSNNEKLAKEYSRLNEIFDDYERNETENVAKGGIASWMLDGNTKMGELGRGAWLYLFEDLNQGYANAESLYARYEKNIDKKEIDDLYTKLYENKDLHKENIQYLKDNNKALSQVNDAQLLMLVRKNEDNSHKNNNAYWDLYNAADDSVQNGNKERDAYKEAKKVAQKLNKSCGNDDNGWNWLNKAIENLGMDDVDYKDMTQADWDKLNAEINRLKK